VVGVVVLVLFLAFLVPLLSSSLLRGRVEVVEKRRW
jgi:hypothetical protein